VKRESLPDRMSGKVRQTLVISVDSQKIEKLNNLKVFGSRKRD